MCETHESPHEILARSPIAVNSLLPNKPHDALANRRPAPFQRLKRTLIVLHAAQGANDGVVEEGKMRSRNRAGFLGLALASYRSRPDANRWQDRPRRVQEFRTREVRQVVVDEQDHQPMSV